MVFTDAGLVWRNFELDASPRHTSKFQDDVKATRLDDLGRHVDHLNLTPAKCERPPQLVERRVKSKDEPVKVAVNEAVDVLSRTSRRVESVLEQSAALQQKKVAAIGVNRALDQPSRPPLASSPILLSAWAIHVFRTFVDTGSFAFAFGSRVRRSAAKREPSCSSLMAGLQ